MVDCTWYIRIPSISIVSVARNRRFLIEEIFRNKKESSNIARSIFATILSTMVRAILPRFEVSFSLSMRWMSGERISR